jgi:hypothetical protein
MVLLYLADLCSGHLAISHVAHKIRALGPPGFESGRARLAASERDLLVGAHAVVVVLPLVAEARSQWAHVSWLRPPDRHGRPFGDLRCRTNAIAAATLVAFVGIELRPARAASPVSAWWRWLSSSPVGRGVRTGRVGLPPALRVLLTGVAGRFGQ